MPESWPSRAHLAVAGGDKGTTAVQSSYKLVSKGVQGMVLVVQPAQSRAGVSTAQPQREQKGGRGSWTKPEPEKVENLNKGMKFAPLPLAMG